MARVISHNDPSYKQRWSGAGANRFNGAYYYSKEIVKNIIPNVKTDRSWLTINVSGKCEDGAIVFIHNNKEPEKYEWLKDFKNLVLVCGVPSTCSKVEHLGKPIYLPLSVDVAEVERFKSEKTEDLAFVGRPSKRKGVYFPIQTHFLENLPRKQLLAKLAKYRRVFAVGRCAIEAKVLGCEILPYDERFPDVDLWQVLDNKEAAKILKERLDEIDGKD